MSNATALKQPDLIRRARAAFVAAAIEEEERSARFVALRAGINPTSFGERLKGRTAFLADELEQIAVALKRDPIAFYADYINAKDQPLDYMAASTGTLTRVDFTARKVVA